MERHSSFIYANFIEKNRRREEVLAPDDIKEFKKFYHDYTKGASIKFGANMRLPNYVVETGNYLAELTHRLWEEDTTISHEDLDKVELISSFNSLGSSSKALLKSRMGRSSGWPVSSTTDSLGSSK